MARKLYDITMFLKTFEERCKRFNISMDECVKRYKYVREWALYKKGIICRDGVLVHLADGSPVTSDKVGTAAETKAQKRPVAPDAPESDPKAPRPVLQYTKTGEFVREWPSVMECERSGFCHGNVSPCCYGKRKTAYGYIWKFKDTTNQ